MVNTLVVTTGPGWRSEWRVNDFLTVGISVVLFVSQGRQPNRNQHESPAWSLLKRSHSEISNKGQSKWKNWLLWISHVPSRGLVALRHPRPTTLCGLLVTSLSRGHCSGGDLASSDTLRAVHFASCLSCGSCQSSGWWAPQRAEAGPATPGFPFLKPLPSPPWQFQSGFENLYVSNHRPDEAREQSLLSATRGWIIQ